MVQLQSSTAPLPPGFLWGKSFKLPYLRDEELLSPARCALWHELCQASYPAALALVGSTVSKCRLNVVNIRALRASGNGMGRCEFCPVVSCFGLQNV